MSKREATKSEPSYQLVPLISPVTKRLVVGKEGAFCRRINEELRLVTVTQKTGHHLSLGIRGSKIAEQTTVDLLANLEKQAQIIANRDGIDSVKGVKDKHWFELEHFFNQYIETAKERISAEQRTVRAVQVAADTAARKVTEQFSPLLKSYKEAAKNKKDGSASVLQKGPITLLGDYQPRNQNSALAYVALHDPDVHVAFLAGEPGGGKTHTAMQWAVEAYNKGLIDKIQIFRPRTVTGKGDLGAFPGGVAGKMGPYAKGAVNKIMIKLTGNGIDHYTGKGIIDADTPDLDRGETHERVALIIDEAQNLTIAEAEMLETRMGDGTKVIFTGDFAGQNDLHLQIPGLAHIMTYISGNIDLDPVLAQSYAFIKYTEDDSEARHFLLPHILKARKNLPPEYAALLATFNGTDRNASRVKALDGIKAFAGTMLEAGALKTAKRFGPTAQKMFPGLFQTPDGNVLKLPVRQIS